MRDSSTLIVFAGASLALAVVPGPAVLYVVAQSIHQGRLAGVVSAAGISVGGLCHVVAAAVGISSLLASSATGFTVVKYAGAAYLVYLGLRRLLGRDDTDPADAGAPKTGMRLFSEGVVVNVLNPKTALFFFAFLPQFVDPDGAAVALQIVALGLTFIVIAFVSDSAYALLAGAVGAWFRRSRAALRAERYVSGTVFLGLGAATALSGSKASS